VLSEADCRVLTALLTRIGHGQNAPPFVVGWVGDDIRLSVFFSPKKPNEALIASARLAATIGIETLVYSFEAFTSPNLEVPPSEDPSASECIVGVGWSGDKTVGWSALVSRDDQGVMSYTEPARLMEVPRLMDRLVRKGLGQPESVDLLTDWLSEYQHSLTLYEGT
jgi:hypothetical protein